MILKMRKLLFLVLIIYSSAISAQKVAVSSKKFNILYVDENNPIDVVVENMKCGDFIVTTNNGTIKGDSCSYMIIPTKSGDATIYIKQITGKDTSIIGQDYFIVKSLHIIKAMVANKSYGVINKANLIKENFVKAYLVNYDFNATIKIKSYKVIIYKGKYATIEKDFKGPLLATDLKTEFNNLEKNDRVSFVNIYADVQTDLKIYKDLKLEDIEFIIE